MSAADQRVLLLRKGIEIGRGPLTVKDPGTPLGTHAFVMSERTGAGTKPVAPAAPMPR